MKEKFAKIIELKDYQVLITKDYDDEEDCFKVNQHCEVDGVRVILGAGYKKEEICNKVFNEYSEKEAKLFVDTTIEMLAEQ